MHDSRQRDDGCRRASARTRDTPGLGCVILRGWLCAQLDVPTIGQNGKTVADMLAGSTFVSSQFPPFATKVISDHEIQIFYRIDGIDVASGPKMVLGKLAAAPGIPEDQMPALQGRYGQLDVWKRDKSTGVGQDFHRHIRDVIGGRRADLATRWSLDDTARAFLASASLYEADTAPKLRVKKHLVLTFSDAARRRLASHAIDSDALVVDIKNITLTLFRTGHGFAATTIELARPDRAPLSAIELLEAQILVVRFGKIFWMNAGNGVPGTGTPFMLEQLIQWLALGRGIENSPERVTTYTYAQFEEPVPTSARDVFAVHLARHYTTDYMTAADMDGIAVVRDFDTVRHTVALEGAATVIGSTPEEPHLPPFVHNFKAGTFRRHYLPIALLARHEHAFLVSRTSSSILSEEEMRSPARTVGRLQKLRESFVFFRLSYRFSELSFVTMHNALNRAFREVLYLDRMLRDLGADVAAAETHLRNVHQAAERHREEERHRRFYGLSVLGGSALAALTTFTILKELLEVFYTEKHAEAVEHIWRLYDLDLAPNAIAAVVGILSFLGALLIGYLKKPGHSEADTADHETGQAMEHADHGTKHAMVDHMIESALK